MKSRLRTPTCGAARPTPSSTSIVSYMPCTSVARSPVISSISRAALLQHGIAEEAQRIRRHRPSLPAERRSDPAGIDIDPKPAQCRAAASTAGAAVRRTAAGIDAAFTSARAPAPTAGAVDRTEDRHPGPTVPQRAAHAAATASRGAAELGQAAERREPERHGAGRARRRPRASDRHRRPRAPPRGRAGGSGAAAPRSARSSPPAEEARPADQEPQRLFGGPGPRAPAAPGRARGTRPGRPPASGPTARWSTASVPRTDRRIGRLVRSRGARHGVDRGVDRGDLGAGQRARRDRRGPGRCPDAARGSCRRGSADTPADTSVAALRAHEAVVVLLHRGAAALAARQLATRVAREQAGAPRAVQHAHARAPRGRRERRRASASSALSNPWPGSSSR